MRIQALVILAGCLLSGVANAQSSNGGGTPAPKRSGNPPNLIIILTDDQGYRDVGFNGCKDIPTPNIDSIASNGVKFSNGYVTYSVCSPSRAGLLTGRYEQRFGHERNPRFEPQNREAGLPLSERTLADVLGQAGYQSGIIGKWHLGAHPDLHPLKRGFNEFFGMLGGGHRYFPEDLNVDYGQAKNLADEYRTPILRNHAPVKTTQYLTDEFSDEAVNFVTRHKDDRFFLYLAYNAPHSPLQASEKYLSRFPNITDPKRRTYAAMVSAVDDGVGKLLAKLRELKLDENTIVFFLSDNGGPTDDNASNNNPLRGGKGSPWEGGWRVPFAVQWPKQIPAGKVFAEPVVSFDIFATMVGLTGASVDSPRPLDGVNLLPYLTGQKTGAPHDYIYLRMFDRGAYAVRNGDYKLVIPARDEPASLFNLTADVAERNNLADTQREQVELMNKKLSDWKAQLVPPVFTGLETLNARPKNSPAISTNNIP